MSKFIQSLQFGTSAVIISLVAIVSGAITTSNASAQENVNGQDRANSSLRDTPTPDDNQERLRQQREALESKKAEAKEAAEARLKARQEERLDRLSASQLEICKTREANINNRIARIADRSTKHLELFNEISERAQAFYESQDVTVTNYDELVADVATKKTAAEATVAGMASTTAGFECEGENPKVTVEAFKTNLKASIEVLKDYRTSVKNLIAGIKSATSAQSNTAAPAEDTQQ